MSGSRLTQALFLLLVFVIAATMPMQNDSWWHLRTGQVIWHTRSLPRHDLFSFIIPPDIPWHNHEWLSQVVMYGAHALGGLPLLTILGAALATFAVWPSYALSAGKPLHRAGFVMLALPLIRVGWAVRPQLFTLAFFALTLWLLAGDRRQRLLPFLFLLWANLHGAVALGGLLLLGALSTALLLDRSGRSGRSRLRRLAVLTALSGAATLCTPLTWHILLFPLEGTRRSRASGNTEFLTPDLHSIRGLLFWAAAALFCFLLLTRWRHLRTWEDRLLATLSVVFLPMAVTSLRTVPHFLLLAVPAMTRLAPPLPSSSAPGPGDDPPRRGPLLLGLGAALALGFLVCAYTAPLPRLSWHPLSAEAIAAVRRAPEPMYNTYDDGGYLIWFTPERKVFVDSREYTYPEDLLLSALRAFRTGEVQALFSRYAIRSALVRPGDHAVDGLLSRGWRPLYRDADWLLLLGPTGK